MGISCKEYNELYKFVEDFIDEEYENNEEFRQFMDTPCEDYWQDYEPTDQTINANWGATKGVIIFNNQDYVLKLPFLKESVERWNSETKEFEREYSDMPNYCSIECKNYDAAVREGLEDMFAETFCVGYFHNVPVYAQQYVDCDEESISSSYSDYCYKEWCEENDLDPDSDDSYEEYFDTDTRYEYEDNSEVYVCMRDYYSSDKFSAFCLFIEKQYINDLHAGNFGFSGGRLVAVDFSGYGGAVIHFHDVQ